MYGALGLKSPPAPTKQLVLPADPRAFARRVFIALGGEARTHDIVSTNEHLHEQRERNQRNSYLSSLARQSIAYVELQEALGRPPELQDFTRSKFSGGEALSSDVDEAWRIFSDVVRTSLTETTAQPSSNAGTAPSRSAPPAPAATSDSGPTATDWSTALSPNEPGPPPPPPALEERAQETWAGKVLKGFRRRR